MKNQAEDRIDEYGNTYAMIMAYENRSIPKEFYHNPSLTNRFGLTVAMIQAN